MKVTIAPEINSVPARIAVALRENPVTRTSVLTVEKWLFDIVGQKLILREEEVGEIIAARVGDWDAMRGTFIPLLHVQVDWDKDAFVQNIIDTNENHSDERRAIMANLQNLMNRATPDAMIEAMTTDDGTLIPFDESPVAVRIEVTDALSVDVLEEDAAEAEAYAEAIRALIVKEDEQPDEQEIAA